MAGNLFNPGSPAVIGEQWIVDLFGSTALGVFAQRIRSRSAETINRLDAWLSPSTLDDQSLLLAEIMPGGSEVPSGALSVVTYQPNADVFRVGWTTNTGSTTNLWNAINESVSTPDYTDYVINPSTFLGQYDFHLNTAAFPSGARVLNVGVRFSAASYSGTSVMALSLRDVAGGLYFHPSGSTFTVVGLPQVFTVNLGEINPLTKLPWTPTDIRGFDTVGNLYGISFSSVASPNAAVYAAEMIVTYQTVENRVAAATHKKPVGANQQTTSYQFQQFEGLPSGTTWSKPSTGDFTILYRMPNYAFPPATPGSPSIPWLASLYGGAYKDCSVPGVMSTIPAVDSYGRVTSIDFSSVATRGRISGTILRTTAPAVSQDSLPYVLDVIGLTLNPLPFPDINSGQTLQQLFTAPQSATYGYFKMAINPNSATADLLVKVKRVSDNVQFGSTITVTAATAQAQAEDANGFRVLVLNMGSGAVLVNATQYYVELSSTDTSVSGKGWQAFALGSDDLAAGIATWNGTTDFVKIGATSYTNLDLGMVFGIPPAAPTGLTVSASNTTNHVPAALQSCVPSAIQAATVSWTATALGVLFDHYEVQRKVATDPDSAFVQIAEIDTESSVSIVDYELARNVGHQYRIRVFRVDGVSSLFTANSSTVTCASKGCEVIFVSNEAQGLGCAYDYEPTTDLTFLSASRDEIVQIYGSDFSVAFMECENVGLSFTRTVVASFGVLTGVPDVTIFQPIRDISRAAVSYVCVLDYVGNKWYAHVQVGAGHWTEPGHSFKADITVTELSNTPSIVVG